MIKRQFILLLSIVLGSIGLNAQPRSEAAAMEMAKQFLGEEARARGTAPITNRLTLVSPEAIGRIIGHDTPKAVTRGVTPNNGFYVFNDERSSRFVIVSGDERQEEVLGYSENELFTTEDIPCGLAYMLSEYHREYQYLSEQEPTASSRAMTPKSVIKKAAAYTSCILQTKWGQRAPYNRKCNGNLAGCVAIAMAQVMYYHKYPSRFSWSDMLTSYSSGYTDKQANAVAQLVSECGLAVNMEYGKDGSSALSCDVAWALAHNFSYNPNIKYYKRDYFSSNEWENIILNELSNKRPIIYGGDNGKSGNARAGHEFVIDGYDGNGFYHINWGWYGGGVNPSYGNGGKSYFKLSSLKPKDGSSMYDYTYGQDMICQISKQTIGNKEHVFYADKFSASNFTVGDKFNFSLSHLSCYSIDANSWNTKFQGYIGYCVYDLDGNFKHWVYNGKQVNMLSNRYLDSQSYSVETYSETFKNGNYYYIYPAAIVPIGNGTANVTRIRTLNGAYDYYLATVKNGKVTLELKGTPPQPDIVAKPKISVSKSGVVTITCSTSGATIYYDCSYKDYDGKYYDDIKNATYSKGFYLLGNAKIRAWAKKGGKQSEYAEYTVNDFKASKPVISVNGNTITITCSTKDAFISYTTDGRTPDPSDYKMDYIDPFTCTTATTIKAIAYYPYWNLSDMATLSFKPTEKLKLTASPASGQVTKGTKVTLTAKTTSGTTISGANIYYTLNGTTPTTSSTKYTSTGITISEACTLKAIAYKDGYEASDVLTEKYTISSDPGPNITLSSLVCDKTNLTQSDKLVLNATFKNTGTTHNLKTKLCICTTTDDGPSIKYSGPEVSKQINQNGTATIKYEYDLANVTPGTYVATVIYYNDWGKNKWYYYNTQSYLHEITVSKSKEKLKLTASPVSGQITKGTKVTLTAKTTSGTTISGANIYYTLNGTTPTTSSTKYTSTGITISEACTLKAKAYKDGYEASDVLTEKYTITSDPITFISLVCNKTNLTQNEVLTLQATFKNTGIAHTLKTKLAICTAVDDKNLKTVYQGTEKSNTIASNGQTTIVYEYRLADVKPGNYVATVMWYKDWAKTEDVGWYYSTAKEKRCHITIKESQPDKLMVTASPASGQVTKGTKVTLTAKTTSGTTISGANIYYTLNGTTPTTSSTKYTSTGITISEACTLKAKAYKDGYEASDVLTEKYTITPPSTITITAKSHTREYGNTNPTFAFEVTGGKISGTPKISCSATKTSAVGTYNIIIEKGSVQGDVKLVNGSLTITKAPLTVRANDCVRMEGENNPTFTLSYSGWKNGENESVITKPTATTTATKSSPSGTYIIKVSGGSAKNYEFKYVNGTLTIKKSKTIAINAANFPDTNFRNYILAQNYGKDGNLTESEIKEVTEMNVSFKKISSLIGIEYFSSLTKLDCNNNKLSSIDISKNTAMKYLNCDYNQITTLNVSNNTELEMLDCSYNQLSKLVVSKNGKLSSLDCKNNQINGIAMDNLIESLPSTKYGFFYVVNSSDENNVCTKSQVAKAKSKGWKAKYWNGSKYLDYDGEEPNFELADGERYYIKNKANGLFISCGGNWGTHIMVDSRGLDLLLKKAKDNVHWIIETNFRTTISDSGGAIGEEGYVDNYVNTELTIKNVQDNVFSIAAPNGKYLAINNSGNSVYFGASSASGKEAQWEFISEKDILAQRKASLQNASASNPVDATFLIKGANINRFDKRIENWYYRRDDDCVFNVNWGCSVEDTEPIFEVFRSDNYYCYGVYTHYQRINLIPGKYKLEAQGFYRDGDYSVAEKARSNGKEKIYAFLFAGDNKVAFKSIFDEASSYAKKGWSTKTKHGYIPDTMNEAGYTFQTGAYNNVLEFTVTKEIEIEIGVAIEESYTLNNWTTIDNFQLTYYGTKATDVKTAKAERQDNAIYSLSGQRLAAPKKGLNIIGGKKVVVH